MKKTRYYIEIVMPGGEHHDWYDVCASAPTPLYKDKTTGETYCYEFSEDTSWAHNRDENNCWRWPVKLIRVEEVEITEEVVELKPGKSQKIQWKSSNKGGNGKNVTLNPKPSNVTKNPGPVRYYDKVEEDGFTRPNKPKNNPPKGTIVGIFTGV
tara:strand:- start:11 stop:472 length:462 start_codon:yes stop_codon:yes gene_type:complete